MSLMLKGLILGVCCTFFAIIVKNIIMSIILFVKMKRMRKNIPSAEKINEDSNICEGPHSWVTINSVNLNGEVREQIICENCGKISGKDLKLNAIAFERFKLEQQRIQENAKFIEELNAFREKELDKIFEGYIKSDGSNYLIRNPLREVFELALKASLEIAEKQNKMLEEKSADQLKKLNSLINK